MKHPGVPGQGAPSPVRRADAKGRAEEAVAEAKALPGPVWVKIVSAAISPIRPRRSPRKSRRQPETLVVRRVGQNGLSRAGSGAL